MNFDLKFDYNEALKRANLNQSQVDVLRSNAKGCALLPKTLTNKQLLLFLSVCDGDVDKALQMLVKHYEIRKKAPQLFTRRDVTLPEIKQSLDNQYYLHLPPTPDNHLVCFHGLKNSIAKNYTYDPATTCFLMMIHALSYTYGPSNGLVLLYDMRNFSSGHLLRNNLRSMKKFFSFIQEAFPIKIHEIHIFNTVPFFHLVMTIIKPFMKAEVAQKMHLHSASLDLEKFHAEFVPRTSLPADFGGACDTVEVLHEKLCKDFLDMREYFMAEEKQAALQSD